MEHDEVVSQAEIAAMQVEFLQGRSLSDLSTEEWERLKRLGAEVWQQTCVHVLSSELL